jgi:site-specific recombinase XerD
MPTIRSALPRFRAYLQRRHYAAHTVDSYLLDLDLFCQDVDGPLSQISFHDVDRFIDQQHAPGLTSATINRRRYALKHLFDFLLEHPLTSVNPVNPSQLLRRGRPLPKPLAQEPRARLFARIQHPMARAVFLLMLRCGLRVSDVAHLKVRDSDWTQQTLRIEQGKGRKDRYVYLSADALASLQECLKRRPAGVPGDLVFWNQTRSGRTLSVKAIQKKMAR